MPRQHLRALFSDSSSRVGSMRPCYVARSPSQTRSQMLWKPRLPAARLLWQTQSRTLSKHRPCAAIHGCAASSKSPCPSSRQLASDIRSDRYPNRARRKSRSSCRKLHFDGRWFLQSTVQIMLCKYSEKGSCTCGTSLGKPHRANESSFHSASFVKRPGGRLSERGGAG